MNTNTTTTTKRWLASFVMAAGLGTAVVTGTGVATADLGTGPGVTNDPGSTAGTTAPSHDVGRRAYNPITIKKEIGVATPQGLTAVS